MKDNDKLFDHMRKEHGLSLTETELNDLINFVRKHYAQRPVEISAGPIPTLLILIAWPVGCVLASGFWSTFFAIFFPPWGWYLIAELALSKL